MKKAQESKN